MLIRNNLNKFLDKKVGLILTSPCSSSLSRMGDMITSLWRAAKSARNTLEAPGWTHLSICLIFAPNLHWRLQVDPSQYLPNICLKFTMEAPAGWITPLNICQIFAPNLHWRILDNPTQYLPKICLLFQSVSMS